jgi:hypothetical protein
MVSKIRFDINSEGEVSVNVECVVGAQCETMTRPFEENLGQVAKKNYKDSYYVETSEEQNTGIGDETG